MLDQKNSIFKYSNKILAIDIGMRAGWACGTPEQVSSGFQDFGRKFIEDFGMRFVRFEAWLEEVHKKEQFSIAYFEEVKRQLGYIAARVYNGFLGQLCAFCVKREIACIGIGVGTIKKFATGKGNAKKDQMIEVANTKFSTKIIKDHNEADALALLYYAFEDDPWKCLDRDSSGVKP